MKILTIIIVLAGLFFVVVSKRKIIAEPGTLGLNAGNVGKAKARVNAAPRNPYRAISIVHDDRACDAVKAIGEKRFLERDRETPTLPLSGCDAAQCNCSYARHHDRRQSDEDRRHPASLQSQLYDRTNDSDRRKKRRGRRKSDWA